MSQQNPAQRYLVRDPQGNVYGPADAPMLRAWVKQGRIVPGMAIAPPETREWVEATSHPAVADLFQPSNATPSTVQPELTDSNFPAVESTSPQLTSHPAYTQTSITPFSGSADQIIPYPLPPRQNVLALLSLIFGCVSIFLCICFWPLSALLALAAITLGCLAMSQIRTNPGTYSGWGMAVTGLVLGIIILLLFVVVVVLFAISMTWHP